MFVNSLSVFWVAVSAVIAVLQALWSINKSTNILKNFDRFDSFLKVLYLFGKFKKEKDDVNGSSGSTARSQDRSSKVLFIFSLIVIPKSWFSHFYVLGTLVHGLVYAVFISLLLGGPTPHLLTVLINWINSGTNHEGLDDNAYPVLIVFTLHLVQVVRRMYECLCVSIFSKGTMNLFHYFMGCVFFATFGIGLLSSVHVEKLFFSTHLSWQENLCYITGLSIFLWGSYYQHRSMWTFAALRYKQKDNSPMGHYIPHGHLFEYVSSPHYFCEILIYTAYCLIFQFRNNYLLSIAIFVWTNQICSGLLAQEWYYEHFPSYPSKRKAIIPYVL